MTADRPEAEALLLQAEKLRQERRFDEALDLAQQVVERHGGGAAHYVRSLAFCDLGRLEDAVAEIGQALAREPQDALLHSFHGTLLADLGRYDEAMACMDRALALGPAPLPTLVSRGVLLHDLGLHRAARESYERALALDPGHAAAHCNHAMLLLQLGEFEEGWREYEWRWGHPHLAGTRPPLGPVWDGRPLRAGGTLLLHWEQGLGDTIQFARLATDAAQRSGARVVLVAPRSLQHLLSAIEGVSGVHAAGEPLPAFDAWCALMSLPHVLRLGEVPAWRGPYLQAGPQDMARWQARLPATRAPRVALVWSGHPGNVRDARRSLDLAGLLEVLPPGPQYLSLQQKHRPGEQALLAGRPDVLEIGSGLDDFLDTAALCELADLVLAVDTSVAHLAGALGRPTWILSRFASDWRWQLDRADSPWYPTVRLFRQHRPLQWDGVLHQAGLELRAWSAQWRPRDAR